LQRSAGRGLTKFVGREREIEALRRAADQAKGGRGQIVANIMVADPPRLSSPTRKARKRVDLTDFRRESPQADSVADDAVCREPFSENLEALMMGG
jgi:hypothetical protein